MAVRFRHRVRLAPGMYWNLGLRSSSISIGAHGARMTFSPRGRRATIGLPGSGLSYTAYEPYRAPQRRHPPGAADLAAHFVIGVAIVFVGLGLLALLGSF